MPTIKIEDHNGTWTPPALQHFKVGEEINWDAGGLTFTLLFQDGSPFQGGDFYIEDSVPRVATKRGRFHYTFVVHDGAKTSVMSACPEIQVGT
jgi:hypothetical protein